MPASSESIMRVSTTPGHSALTRMPSGPVSLVRLRMMPMTACFEATYGATPASPLSPAMDEVNRMRPPLACCVICRTAAAAPRKTLRTLTRRTRSKSSMSAWATSLTTPSMPALAWNMSTEPNRSTAAAKNRSVSVALDTSACDGQQPLTELGRQPLQSRLVEVDRYDVGPLGQESPADLDADAASQRR